MKVTNWDVHDERVSFDLACTNDTWIELVQRGFVSFVEFDFRKSYKNYLDERVVAVMERLKKYYEEKPTFDNLWRLMKNNPRGFELVARITTDRDSLNKVYKQKKDSNVDEWKIFSEWIKKEVLL